MSRAPLSERFTLFEKGCRAGACSQPRPSSIAVYLNRKVAILFAFNIVYQGSPLGATVMPNGSLFLTTLPSVMTPASVIRAMLPLVVWVNHTEPSEEAGSRPRRRAPGRGFGPAHPGGGGGGQPPPPPRAHRHIRGLGHRELREL